MYVAPPSVWFLGLFRLKVKPVYTLPTLIWELQECVNVFIVSISNEEENEVETDANSKLEHLKKFFVAH